MEAPMLTQDQMPVAVGPTVKRALTPIAFGGLDSTSRKWLTDLGFASGKSILAFDTTKETVTMLIDGEAVERQVCQIWSRVMGYHRPVAAWNLGKKCEHRDRKMFTEAQVVRAG